MGFSVNIHGDTILPAVTANTVVHGRMVILCEHTENEYGFKADLPGVRYPASEAEAALAKYVCLFPDDNRSTPIYEPEPHYNWALRQGFDQAGNSPITGSTVYTMNPGDYDTPQTIPSGALARVYPKGTFTVPSGGFVYSASLITPGAQLTVEYTGDDQGKLKYGASNVVAQVVHFNSDASLTFRIS